MAVLAVMGWPPGKARPCGEKYSGDFLGIYERVMAFAKETLVWKTPFLHRKYLQYLAAIIVDHLDGDLA
ncbi:MAG: hypothetical protein KJ630_15360 [Proteobacteria bacterium]|nr:hypothetical protein [Pseudomonadota bacterium]